MLDLKKAQQIAVQSVIKAGKYLKSSQTKVHIKKSKDKFGDIQTTADLEAEKIIIDLIQKNYPDHNIFSEEKGLIDRQSDYTWVIDPLDGTKEYFRGLSTYLSLVSLQDKKKLLCGCVYEPATQNVYTAASGFHSFKNQHCLQVSSQKNLTKSIVSVYLPNSSLSKTNQQAYWQKITRLTQQIYRLRGSHFNALDICYVAQGAYEAHFCFPGFGPKWHDLASSLIVAQQAKAKITDIFGQPLVTHDLSKGIIVTNGLIHQKILSIINQKKL